MKNEAMFETLVGVIREHANAGEFPAYLRDMPITPKTSLNDLGLDSLCKMSLLTALMDHTDKYFPDEFFQGNRTLEEIVDQAV